MNTKCNYITSNFAPTFVITIAVALVVLKAGAQGILFPSPENIVQNWSFESISNSQAVPWTGYYGVGDSQVAANGEWFIQPITYAAQTLATTPGQEYQISFAVSGLGGTSIIDLSWDSQYVGDTASSANGLLNSDWVYGTFDVTATTASTVLGFQPDPKATTGHCFLDAVQVIPIPEPPVTSLLLGGLLFIAQTRRKRTSA